MKVIIIKDCKDGKINDIVDVSAGYATNFLIRQKLALPFNSKTEHMLKNKFKSLEDNEKIKRLQASKIKEKIELIKLNFNLKVTNLVIHGSITKKQINKELIKNEIKLDSHSIENIKISSLGITKIKIKIYKDIEAILKVEVNSEK